MQAVVLTIGLGTVIGVELLAVSVLLTPAVAALSRANVHNVPLGPTPAVGASQVWKTG